MKSRYHLFKNQAIILRQQGRTYGEIQELIGKPIPKSTLSYWFHALVLPVVHSNRISQIIAGNIKKAQLKAVVVNKARRKKYIEGVIENVVHLPAKLDDKNTAKIALAMLYLGEGAKKSSGSVMLGNSDPQTIRLFLKLLRMCYVLDENKFRCTLQCRADQDIEM